jgi:uncharacterized membrane protein YfcA
MSFELVLDFELVLLVALVGLVVGAISGIFGVGGGFLIVPALNVLVGIPAQLAVGAGCCQILGPATTSLLARRIRPAELRLPLIVSGGLLLGAFAGGELLHRAQESQTVSLPSGEVPLVDIVVLVVYLVLLLSLSVFSFWALDRMGREGAFRPKMLRALAIPPRVSFPEFDLGQLSIPLLSWSAMGLGFLAGLIGVSGGLILVPAMVYVLGMPTQRAIRISLIIVWIVALESTVIHAWNDYIDLKLVLALLLGGTLGARFGSELGLHLRGRQLRRAFGWLLLLTAGLIALRLCVLLIA